MNPDGHVADGPVVEASQVETTLVSPGVEGPSPVVETSDEAFQIAAAAEPFLTDNSAAHQGLEAIGGAGVADTAAVRLAEAPVITTTDGGVEIVDPAASASTESSFTALDAMDASATHAAAIEAAAATSTGVAVAAEAKEPNTSSAEKDSRIAAINDKIANGTATQAERAEHSQLLAAQRSEKELPDAIKAVQEGNATARQQEVYERWQTQQQTKEYDDLQARVEKGEPLTDDEKNHMAELKGELGKEDIKELTPEQELEQALNEFDPSKKESYAPFLTRMQELAGRLHGSADSKQMQEAFAATVKEHFDRENMAGLTEAEREALAEVKGDIASMRRDIMAVVTARKQVETLERERDQKIEEIKTFERQAPQQLREDDRRGQENAFKLTQGYNELAVANARIILTARQAELANEDFRFKRARVRRALGVTGFWSGMTEQTMTYVRNIASGARREAITGLKQRAGARPLAA